MSRFGSPTNELQLRYDRRQPKVIPDWREETPHTDDATDAEAAKAVATAESRVRMAAFFSGQSAAAAAQQVAAICGKEVARKANLHYGLAFEKAMAMGIGITMDKFVPAQPLGPLGPTEIRYLQDIDSPLLGRQTRSCIKNHETGSKRVEYPVTMLDGRVHEPTLYTSSDRGSLGRVFFDFSVHGLGLRQVHQYDFFHIVEGFKKDSYSDVSLKLKKLEAATSYRCLGGAYGTCSFFLQIQRAATAFFANNDSTNDVYGVCYARICDDRKISYEIRSRSSHREELWRVLPSSGFLHAVGFMPVLGRWGDFEEKHESIKPDRSVILMITIDMGLKKKWWPSISKSPVNIMECLDFDLHDDDEDAVGDHAELAGALPPGPSAACPAAPKMSVAASNNELKQIRSKKVNTMDFMAWYYADRQGLRLMDAHNFVLAAVIELFKMTLTSHKTLWGHANLFRDLTEGLFAKTINAIWQTLKDPSVLKALDLMPKYTGDVVASEGDLEVTNVMTKGAIALSGDLALYEFEFTHSMYGFSARLLQTDEALLAKDFSVLHLSVSFFRVQLNIVHSVLGWTSGGGARMPHAERILQSLKSGGLVCRSLRTT